MALKGTILCYMGFVGDGSSTTLTIVLSTAPVGFTVPNGGSLDPTFSIASPLPTAVRNPTCNGGAVTSISVLLGIVTVNLGFTPANGTNYMINFDLDY